jgi:NhaP-type Na+/H+ or K+/H+ antiporter
LLVLVGIGFGALINYMEPRVFPEFGPELFFHWLLPPIILEAAYSLYHRAFLQNIGTILLFAVVVSMQHILFMQHIFKCLTRSACYQRAL